MSSSAGSQIHFLSCVKAVRFSVRTGEVPEQESRADGKSVPQTGLTEVFDGWKRGGRRRVSKQSGYAGRRDARAKMGPHDSLARVSHSPQLIHCSGCHLHCN